MKLQDLLVLVQVGTEVGLAVLFWHAGLKPLAIAQLAYGVATVVLFYGQ